MDVTVPGTLCQLRDAVAQRIGENRFQTWFGETACFDLDGQRLDVAVANAFAANWIASNYTRDIAAAASHVLGNEVVVSVRVRDDDGPERIQPRHPRPRSGDADGPVLRNRLDTFVVGPSNRLAHAAAAEVARSAARNIKLLIIHGACGLGKTHLLQGICNGFRQNHPELKWRYLSGEEFTNEFIGAVKSGRSESFRMRFRNADLLVIDDIHFLENKRATQDEFLHTFDAIDSAGRAVVLSSDRHPRMLATLGEPLVNRLISGVVIEVQQPDYGTRLEILRRRAESMSCDIPDEVLEFVARHIRRNVREIEGALYKLAALSVLTRDAITLDLARLVLEEHVVRGQRSIDATDIERVACAYFGVTRDQLHSRSRDRTVTLARGVTMHLIRRHTSLSFPEIGRLMGSKNHSTVLMANKRIEELAARQATVCWRNGNGPHEAAIVDVLAALSSELRMTH